MYLFPKAKSALKGTDFQSVDEGKLKTADLLNRVSADDLQHCFEQRKIRMQQCIDRGESMLKGIEILTRTKNEPENPSDSSTFVIFLGTREEVTRTLCLH
jgi:hypothetical protein